MYFDNKVVVPTDIHTQRVASYYTTVAKRLDGSSRHLVRKYRPPRRPHCIRRVPSDPQKGHSSHSTPPPFYAHVYCGHGHPSQLLLSSCSTLLWLLPVSPDWAALEVLLLGGQWSQVVAHSQSTHESSSPCWQTDTRCLQQSFRIRDCLPAAIDIAVGTTTFYCHCHTRRFYWSSSWRIFRSRAAIVAETIRASPTQTRGLVLIGTFSPVVWSSLLRGDSHGQTMAQWIMSMTWLWRQVRAGQRAASV